MDIKTGFLNLTFIFFKFWTYYFIICVTGIDINLAAM